MEIGMVISFFIRLIRQVKQENVRLKGEFRSHVDDLNCKVEQFSDQMPLKTTVLYDLYINGTHLADRKADKLLLKEFDEVSSGLIGEKSNIEYETGIPLQLPYLKIGKVC